jgi:hypothetical protein
MAPDERPISDWLLADFCPVFFKCLSSLAAFLLLRALQALPVNVKKAATKCLLLAYILCIACMFGEVLH